MRARLTAVRVVCTLAVFLGGSHVWAQPSADQRPDMVTDRPDFTESSDVIPPGLFQFESGVSYEGNTRNGVPERNLVVPGALMRIGLLPRVELRLGGDGFLSQNVDDLSTSGYSDLEVGVKARLLDQRRAGIDLAVIPMVSLPIGSDGFTSGGIDPTVKITWARDVPAGFDVSGNFNFASVTDDLGRFNRKTVSVSMAHDLVAGWGGFIETYGFTPMERDSAWGVTLDFGVTRSIGRDFQFDVEAGRGLTAAAPDWFVGLGFAVRGRAGGKP